MTAPGWFGKLASLGDFASRRLAPDWVRPVDRWLSAGMAAGERRLGEAWWPAYLRAPLWRFAWAPGVVDAQWWFGVLMPSCDRVGRYYPLVVAQSRPSASADPDALAHLERWWTEAAQAALHTLDEGANVEAFEAALAGLPPWPDAPAAERQPPLAGQSLWWPWRPQASVSTTSPSHQATGLPDPAAFITLMAGG